MNKQDIIAKLNKLERYFSFTKTSLIKAVIISEDLELTGVADELKYMIGDLTVSQRELKDFKQRFQGE